MDDTPPFDCLDAALRFAYRIEWESISATSQLGKLHIKWKPEYTVGERRAQAAMIRSHVDANCTPAQRAFVECQYRIGRRRFELMKVLVRHCLPYMRGPKVNAALVRELAYRFFREGVSYEMIAAMVKLDRGTVTRYNERLWPIMLSLQAQVSNQLEAEFRAAGVIP